VQGGEGIMRGIANLLEWRGFLTITIAYANFHLALNFIAQIVKNHRQPYRQRLERESPKKLKSNPLHNGFLSHLIDKPV
jgi:hypothetical protein